MTGEALVSIFVIGNTIGMLLSLYTANWIERQGTAPVFGEMTAIQTVSVLFAIPLFSVDIPCGRLLPAMAL